MSLSGLQVADPPREACDPGCLLCTTSRTPMKAYRPHGLDGHCWCTFGPDGEKFSHRAMCWVYTTYLKPREAPLGG